jgi:hypothetical protein
MIVENIRSSEINDRCLIYVYIIMPLLFLKIFLFIFAIYYTVIYAIYILEKKSSIILSDNLY